MNEYQGVILLGALVAGIAPVTIMIVYCLLTGRTAALFSPKKTEQIDDSPFLKFMVRLYLILFPAYIILLCLYAFLNLSGTGSGR